MVDYTDFAGGMIAGSIRSRQAAMSGGTGRVFDWDKAAQIIKDRKPAKAEAGLQEDWGYTSGRIYEDEAIIDGDYLYLFSMWATPILRLNGGEEIPCFIEGGGEKNPNNWDSGTVWPDTARAILFSSFN